MARPRTPARDAADERVVRWVVWKVGDLRGFVARTEILAWREAHLALNMREADMRAVGWRCSRIDEEAP